MLNDFQTFNKDRLQLDELIALLVFGKALKAEFEAQKIPAPEYVDVQLKSLRLTVQARVADQRETRKRKIKAQLQQLKTPSERKADLEAELQELETV